MDLKSVELSRAIARRSSALLFSFIRMQAAMSARSGKRSIPPLRSAQIGPTCEQGMHETEDVEGRLFGRKGANTVAFELVGNDVCWTHQTCSTRPSKRLMSIIKPALFKSKRTERRHQPSTNIQLSEAPRWYRVS